MIGDHDDVARDNLGPGPTDDTAAEAPDYDVGYRKPPKSGQFKPGQSGNPRGRKKRQPTIAERLNKELARKVTITEHGKKRSVSKLDLIFMTLSNQAAKGELKAVGMIINLLNTQATENSPDLNTDVMNPEDLAILERFLAGMEVGEPFVDTGATADNASTEQHPGTDDCASPEKSADVGFGAEPGAASGDTSPTEPGPPSKPAIPAEAPPPPATTRQDYKPMVQPPQWRRPDDKH